MVTPTLFSLHHRTFRCLGLAGPLVLFSLNLSAGPTRQLHTLFRLPREPSPPRRRCSSPVRRRSRAACSPLQAAAAPELSTAPPPACAPTPLLRCCSAAARAPTPRLCHPRAAAHRHRRPLHTRAASPAPISLPCSSIQDRFEFPPLLIRVHAKCSRNCHLGRFRRFHPRFARVWPTHY